MPKAVYRSSCRDKYNRLQCGSNLGPLTPQSDALTNRLQRPEIAVSWVSNYPMCCAENNIHKTGIHLVKYRLTGMRVWK